MYVVWLTSLTLKPMLSGAGGEHPVWSSSDEVSQALALFWYQDGLHRVYNCREILNFWACHFQAGTPKRLWTMLNHVWKKIWPHTEYTSIKRVPLCVPCVCLSTCVWAKECPEEGTTVTGPHSTSLMLCHCWLWIVRLSIYTPACHAQLQ